MKWAGWTAFGLSVAWYIGFWARLSGAVGGSWWLWGAPLYGCALLCLWWRWETRAARRRGRERGRRLLGQLSRDFLRRHELPPPPVPSKRLEKPAPAVLTVRVHQPAAPAPPPDRPEPQFRDLPIPDDAW